MPASSIARVKSPIASSTWPARRGEARGEVVVQRGLDLVVVRHLASGPGLVVSPEGNEDPRAREVIGPRVDPMLTGTLQVTQAILVARPRAERPTEIGLGTVGAERDGLVAEGQRLIGRRAVPCVDACDGSADVALRHREGHAGGGDIRLRAQLLVADRQQGRPAIRSRSELDPGGRAEHDRQACQCHADLVPGRSPDGTSEQSDPTSCDGSARDDATKIVREVEAGRVAAMWGPLQRLEHDGLEIPGNRRVDPSGGADPLAGSGRRAFPGPGRRTRVSCVSAS